MCRPVLRTVAKLDRHTHMIMQNESERKRKSYTESWSKHSYPVNANAIVNISQIANTIRQNSFSLHISLYRFIGFRIRRILQPAARLRIDDDDLIFVVVVVVLVRVYFYFAATV